MKFSIKFLLILIMLAALAMLSVRTRVAIEEQKAEIAEMKALVAQDHREHLIRLAQHAHCLQALDAPVSNEEQIAVANFDRLRTEVLQAAVENPREPCIVSVPVIALGQQRRYQYRVFVPRAQKIGLSGKIVGRNNKQVTNLSLFQPSSFDQVLPNGNSLVEILVKRAAGSAPDFGFGKRGVFQIQVSVKPLGEDGKTFQWETIHDQPEVPYFSAPIWMETKKLFRTSRRTRVFTATHMKNRRSAERFEVSLQLIDDLFIGKEQRR